MNTLNCEFVRDTYVDVLHGRAQPDAGEAIRRHVEACVQCREELKLVAQLFAAETEVPVGLEARVLAGLREARGARPAARWLLAATIVFVALGGALVFRSGERAPVRESLMVQEDESGLGVIGVEGALVSGTATLQDLSIEELEQLLGEMES